MAGSKPLFDKNDAKGCDPVEFTDEQLKSGFRPHHGSSCAAAEPCESTDLCDCGLCRKHCRCAAVSEEVNRSMDQAFVDSGGKPPVTEVTKDFMKFRDAKVPAFKPEPTMTEFVQKMDRLIRAHKERFPQSRMKDSFPDALAGLTLAHGILPTTELGKIEQIVRGEIEVERMVFDDGATFEEAHDVVFGKDEKE